MTPPSRPRGGGPSGRRATWGPALSAALARTGDGEDLVGTGADLRPQTLLDAYARGLFPMGLGGDGRPPLGWWSPDPRGVLPLEALRVSRSLRRSRAQVEVSVDRAFAEVVDGCADPRRSGRWITPQVRSAYLELHRLGHAHSVEVWDAGGLAGGLYGVVVGGLFAGESMFHRRTDASKVALVHLVELLREDDGDAVGASARLLDVQWRTPHLASLGVVEIPRRAYLGRLSTAIRLPRPAAFTAPPPEVPREPRPGTGPGERPGDGRYCSHDVTPAPTGSSHGDPPRGPDQEGRR